MSPGGSLRLAALRRFAVAITLLNVLGHSWLGFEQPLASPFVGVLTACFVEIVLELVTAVTRGRPSKLRGGPVAILDFLLPAHISGLAVSMLLYSNQRLEPVAFAATVAIASKFLFRAPVGGGERHFLNPSNFGIAVTLFVFPWVGLVPPYHFTENVSGALDWILPGIIIVTGSLLNARYTKRLPLIAAWFAGFFAQALVRSWLFETPLGAPLSSMTGLAFLLFSFYMVSDPATTPARPSAQVGFGLFVAALYGLVTAWHVVFGLFLALVVACTLRGLYLHALAFALRHRPAPRASWVAQPSEPG